MVQGSSLARGGRRPERTAAQPLARRARGGKPRVKPVKWRAKHAMAESQNGEMAERFKAPVLKTGEGSNLPWVRIPLSPPLDRLPINREMFHSGAAGEAQLRTEFLWSVIHESNSGIGEGASTRYREVSTAAPACRQRWIA